MSSESYPVTVPSVFRKTADAFADRTAMRQKRLGVWHDISWAEYEKQSRYLSRALIERGFEKGDCAAILGDNCPEWVLIDLGIQRIGGISAGIYATSSADQVAYVVNHSDAKVLFVENEEQLDKWLQIQDRTPKLELVIFWDKKGLREFSHPKVTNLDAFWDEGRKAEHRDSDVLEREQQISPDDVAILVYTSGTTGDPKGAMLTHKNVTWIAQTICDMDPKLGINEHEEVMSFLPLCHIFERLFSVFIHITKGYTVNFIENLDTIADNMREISPTVGYAVPRIWEKYYSTVYIKMSEATLLKKWIYALALSWSSPVAEQKMYGKPISGTQNILYKLAQFLVFKKLRERLGMERMRIAYSGAAPISPKILHFFHAIGLNLVEGYGQTEGSGVASGARSDSFKPGSVGLPVPGSEIKLAEDGEILVKSPAVFKGYYKNEQATSETIKDGWLHSGDIGEIDEEGFLKIVDRKKDIIITAGGKNIAPQYIENKLKFSPYINDAIVIGDQRKFIAAIIVLDEENTIKFAQDHKIPFATYADLTTSKEILALISEEVKNVNKELARVESVREFRILPKKLYEEDGEVTPTMKVKRKFVNEAYKDLIEEMYAIT